MTAEYRFETTIEPKKLRQVLALSGSEWSGAMTPEEFGNYESKALIDFVLRGNPGRAFYLESRTGQILASCVITQQKGFFKEAGRSTIGTVPDPSSFGVNNITAIRLSYVFVAKQARGHGFFKLIVAKAIEYTEAEILEKELSQSSDKNDSFKSMVSDGESIDYTLAQHYLGKKYVWFLYSSIDSAYTKFGFKSYPLEGYEIDPFICEGRTHMFVKMLLSPQASRDSGKKLRLLDGANQADRDLIDSILQGKQLELLIDINKNVYHSELQGESHSSSSLTNLSDALSASASKYSKGVSSVTTQFKESVLGTLTRAHSTTSAHGKIGEPAQRRKSSILSFGYPKFAILPNINDIDHVNGWTRVFAHKAGSEMNKKFASIYGAILTNELQEKSFYVLWMSLKGKEFHIIAMGELNVDLFGAQAAPLGLTNPISRRRSSSFTGLNDMGGYNFQDLDLLVNTAMYVAQKQVLGTGKATVFVSVNDLPTSIPRPVLHDFFLNYLPKSYQPDHNTYAAGYKANASKLVKFVDNFSQVRKDLPMLRKYGNSDGNFDLDWMANSLSTWG